jgi:hypothetical protein
VAYRRSPLVFDPSSRDKPEVVPHWTDLESGRSA